MVRWKGIGRVEKHSQVGKVLAKRKGNARNRGNIDRVKDGQGLEKSVTKVKRYLQDGKLFPRLVYS